MAVTVANNGRQLESAPANAPCPSVHSMILTVVIALVGAFSWSIPSIRAEGNVTCKTTSLGLVYQRCRRNSLCVIEVHLCLKTFSFYSKVKPIKGYAKYATVLVIYHSFDQSNESYVPS